MITIKFEFQQEMAKKKTGGTIEMGKYDFCKCEKSASVTSGFEDSFGYWMICCECGKKIEDEYHYYNHYDGEDHDEDFW